MAFRLSKRASGRMKADGVGEPVVKRYQGGILVTKIGVPFSSDAGAVMATTPASVATPTSKDVIRFMRNTWVSAMLPMRLIWESERPERSGRMATFIACNDIRNAKPSPPECST